MTPTTDERLTATQVAAAELARLRRIEAAARALDLRPDRAVTHRAHIAALREALEEKSK